jgi:hypothetical protein
MLRIALAICALPAVEPWQDEARDRRLVGEPGGSRGEEGAGPGPGAELVLVLVLDFGASLAAPRTLMACRNGGGGGGDVWDCVITSNGASIARRVNDESNIIS